MVAPDRKKAWQTRLLAARLRLAAGETEWPLYREKLLQVARELEEEADKLDDQQAPRLPSRGASSAG